jgi:hypothetical protein
MHEHDILRGGHTRYFDSAHTQYTGDVQVLYIERRISSTYIDRCTDTIYWEMHEHDILRDVLTQYIERGTKAVYWRCTNIIYWEMHEHGILRGVRTHWIEIYMHTVNWEMFGHHTNKSHVLRNARTRCTARDTKPMFWELYERNVLRDARARCTERWRNKIDHCDNVCCTADIVKLIIMLFFLHTPFFSCPMFHCHLQQPINQSQLNLVFKICKKCRIPNFVFVLMDLKKFFICLAVAPRQWWLL